MQNHYLQLVSEETGRLARLIQNMLDLSKLELSLIHIFCRKSTKDGPNILIFNG